MPTKLYQYIIESVTQPSENYISVRSTEDEPLELDSLSLKMLRYNSMHWLVPMYYEEWNHQIMLMYSTNHLIALPVALNRTSSPKSIVEMLLQIVSAIIKSNAYLMNSENYVLQPSWIFIEPETNAVRLIYLPIISIHQKEPIRHELSNLIKEYLNKDNVMNWKEIHHFVQNDGYDLGKLKQLLQQSVDILASQELAQLSITDKSTQLETPVTDNISIDHKKIMTISLKSVTSFIPRLTHSLILWLAFSAIALYITVVFFLEESSAYVVTGGYCTFTAILIYTINNRNIAASMKMALQTQPDLNRYYELLPQSTTLLVPDQQTVLLRSLQSKPVQRVRPEVYFELIQGEHTERVKITSDSFIVGRDQEAVQHVEKGTGTSRLHFEIVYDVNYNGYAVKDLGSRNGSFLNHEPMLPGKQYPLSDGDVIKIIQAEYHFRYSKPSS